MKLKLPNGYFENLSAQKYKEYLKLLPDFKKENTQLITTLIFTFVAMSFFGIFAINPTLSTITQLKKQLTDSEFVHQQLTTKINNLSSLQQQYNSIETDLPIVYAAVPQNPQATLLSGQIEALAQETNISLVSLHVFEIQIASNKPAFPNGASYTFFFEGQGEYENMMDFATKLSQISRIVTIETMSITKESKEQGLHLSIRGRVYLKK